MNGFLGTGATFRADLNLVVQIAMGVALLVGMRLARKKNFRAHKYCQSAVMILNLLMIFLIMVPFHDLADVAADADLVRLEEGGVAPGDLVHQVGVDLVGNASTDVIGLERGEIQH